MSVLTDLRDDLKAKLETAGLFAFTIVPEAAVPPFVFAAPDDPYVSFEGGMGLAYGEAIVRHRLGLVVPAGVNEVEANTLDDLILQVLSIDFAPHVVQAVDEPGQIQVNRQTHLAVAIHLEAPISILEGQ